MTTTTQTSKELNPSETSEKSGALVKQESSSISLYTGMKNGLSFSAPIIHDSGVWYEWLD